MQRRRTYQAQESPPLPIWFNPHAGHACVAQTSAAVAGRLGRLGFPTVCSSHASLAWWPSRLAQANSTLLDTTARTQHMYGSTFGSTWVAGNCTGHSAATESGLHGLDSPHPRSFAQTIAGHSSRYRRQQLTWGSLGCHGYPLDCNSYTSWFGSASSGLNKGKLFYCWKPQP